MGDWPKVTFQASPNLSIWHLKSFLYLSYINSIKISLLVSAFLETLLWTVLG